MLSRLAYAILGIVVVALSFSATLFALNLWSGHQIAEELAQEITTASIPSASPAAPAPEAGAPQEASANTLPRLAGSGFQWIGLNHLNIRIASTASVVKGQPILQLTPTVQDGYHTLGGQISGLNKDHAYRITAWVKPTGGGNVEVEVADRPNGQSLHYATGLFDLSGHRVLGGQSDAKQRGIDQGPDDWQRVWLEVTTSDGQFNLAIRPASGALATFQGDGRLGVLLGGVEVTPRS